MWGKYFAFFVSFIRLAHGVWGPLDVLSGLTMVVFMVTTSDGRNQRLLHITGIYTNMTWYSRGSVVLRLKVNELVSAALWCVQVTVRFEWSSGGKFEGVERYADIEMWKLPFYLLFITLFVYPVGNKMCTSTNSFFTREQGVSFFCSHLATAVLPTKTRWTDRTLWALITLQSYKSVCNGEALLLLI